VIGGALATAFALASMGCRPTDAAAPGTEPLPDSGALYVPTATWRTTSPVSAGFDQGRFDALKRNVSRGQFGTIDALIVVRYGFVALEQYKEWSPTQPHTMQSVSKSVTSLLLGILSQNPAAGLSDLDRPVLDVFRRYPSIANVDDRKRALTLRNLLTMRTAMDFYEQPYAGSPLDELNRSSGDWVKYVLDRPMTGTPGTTWAYNSGAAIVIGGVVRELSGTNVDEFARHELFEPIGAAGEYWFKSPYDGLPHCGGGLFLKPMDLARVGYLVLRQGRWGDRQVVPASWIEASTAVNYRGNELIFSSFNSAYGYFWWLFPTRRGGTDAGVIAASGSGGQWLFVVPSLDLVVAIAASNGAGLDLLYDGVLAALRTPPNQ
jgi:CubicO group peptidase (beta-lactamase class C family)